MSKSNIAAISSEDDVDVSVGIPEEYLSDPSTPVSEMVHCATIFRNKNQLTNSKPWDQSQMGNFIWADPKDLVINFRAQRWPDDKHIKNIYDKFDNTLCTPLIAVYKPETGKYHVSDGLQHGLAYLNTYYTAIGKGLKVPVWYVIGDESVEDKLVMGLNRDNLPMSRYFIHALEVKQQKPTALAIEKMCNRAGVVPAFRTKGKKPCITHVTNLYLAYNSLGSKNTEKALEVLTNAFPLDEKGNVQHINSLVMLGLAYIFKQMKEQNVYSDAVAEDIGLALHICFANMDSVHKDIKFWFEKQKQNKLEVRNMGRYSSGILRAYEKLTGQLPVAPDFPDINPIGMYAGFKRKYANMGGLHA
jgi:hypothetical protein